MRIKDIIYKVDKSEKFKCDVYIGEIAGEFHLDISNWDCHDRLTSYYIGDWYCTDSRVGYKVYFFDNKPVAVSSQTGRKCDENIEWLSKDLYNLVKEYVISFLVTEEYTIFLANLEDEIHDYYKINYHSQLFEYHKDIPLYNKENVKIIEYHTGQKHNDNNQYEPSLVRIEFKDNKTKWVELKELDFPYNIITEK